MELFMLTYNMLWLPCRSSQCASEGHGKKTLLTMIIMMMIRMMMTMLWVREKFQVGDSTIIINEASLERKGR